MDIKEKIIQTEKIIKEIEVILLQKNLKNKQFLPLKAKYYELSLSLQELEKMIYALKERELNKIMLNSAFVLFYKKLNEIFEGLEEKDIQAGQEEYFKLFQEEFSSIFESLKNTLKILKERFLTPKEEFMPSFTKKYLTKRNKNPYAENETLVRKVEEKIITYFNGGNTPGGSNIAKRSSKSEHLHAWIPAPLDNHRILYDFNPKEKKIIFLDLGTHKELGLSEA